VTRLEQTFEAVAADAEIAKLLQVDEGWPIFQVETVMFRDRTPIEYRLARYRGDHYKFALERSLDD
jgi:GntR family transcriptional regulator